MAAGTPSGSRCATRRTTSARAADTWQGAEHQLPVASCQLPVTSSQLPVASCQWPVASSQWLSATGYCHTDAVVLGVAVGLSILGSLGGVIVASSFLLLHEQIRIRMVPW